MAVKGMTEFRADGENYTINDPNIANEFDATAAYAVGDYVNYQGDLWRFTASHSAGAWTGTDAVNVRIGKEVSDLKLAVDQENIYDAKIIFQWESGTYGSATKTERNDYLVSYMFSVIPGSDIYVQLNTEVYNAIGFTWYNGKKEFVNYVGRIDNNGRKYWVETVPDDIYYCRVNISKSYQTQITPAMYAGSYCIVSNDSTGFESAFKNNFIPGMAHDGQGGYAYFGPGREATTHPVKFPFPVLVMVGGSSPYDVGYQLYSSPHNSADTLIYASSWLKSFVIQPEQYFCVIARDTSSIPSEDFKQYITVKAYVDAMSAADLALYSLKGDNGQIYNSVEEALNNGKPYKYYGSKISLDGFSFNSEVLGNDLNTGYVPQGACIYGDELFQMYTGSKFAVYDLENNTLSTTFSFDPNLGYYHSNSACFGQKQNSGDQYPLLYTNSYLDDVGKGICIVQKLTKTNNVFTAEFVQSITIGFTDDPIWTGELLNPSTLGNGNFVVDLENKRLIAYTTQGFSRTRFFLFDIPDPSEPSVTLTTSDILDYFDVGYIANIQDSCIRKGTLYMTSGINWGDEQYLRMYAIDIKGQAVTSYIDLSEVASMNNEPEGIDYYKGALIMTNVSGVVYKLTF